MSSHSKDKDGISRRDFGARLGAAAPEAEAPEGQGETGKRRKVSFVAFPVRYYIGAVAFGIVLFVGLRVRSASVVAHSPIGCACLASGQQDLSCKGDSAP